MIILYITYQACPEPLLRLPGRWWPARKLTHHTFSHIHQPHLLTGECHHLHHLLGECHHLHHLFGECHHLHHLFGEKDDAVGDFRRKDGEDGDIRQNLFPGSIWHAEVVSRGSFGR